MTAVETTAEPRFVGETLRWCNRQRAKKGREPLAQLPKGSRINGSSCPCGEATGLYVGSHKWYPDRGSAIAEVGGKKLPVSVERFVSVFDAGLLPQYDKDES